MAAPAIMGLRVKPVKGKSTPIAKGMESTLYPKAQNRLRWMVDRVCFDRWSAGGMPEILPAVSVILADSMAKAVPVPMAKLTSA